MSKASQADVDDGANLMDDQWQKQQQKTFTAWVNSHLRKVNVHVDDVQTDFCDGHNLIKLLEIISEDTLAKPAKGKMRIHKIQNVGSAFQFIKDKGVKLVSIAPEEIVDGNLKMILGMLWTLILRFEIQDISLDDLSAKDALLLWCQRKTQGYKNVKVDNFHMSWKDGLAFNALIHRHRPELLNFDALRKDDPQTNWKTCLETADKHLDIPPMLEADDMINCVKPDERSVMTYVAMYYKAFASSSKAEVAAKKIATVLETNREHERLIAEYEEMASNLLAWINATIERLSARPTLDTVQVCQQQMQEWASHRAEEFPPKLEEKGNLENHYSSLQTKLRLSGRPAYVPSEGKLISDIQAAWGRMEEAETANKEWIVSELKRNQIIENKAEKFQHRADTHESWTQDKDSSLQDQDYLNENLGGIVALKKKHEAFQSDLAAHEARVVEIGNLANELDELKYIKSEEVNARYSTIFDNWQKLVALTQERQTALDTREAELLRLDEIRLEYAKQVAPFMNWVDASQSFLKDNYIANTEQDAADLWTSHNEWKGQLPEKEAELASLNALVQSMQEFGTSENPYCNHSPVECEAKWNELQIAVQARETQLQQEAELQASREALRKEWAEKASEVHSWIRTKQEAVQSVLQAADFQKMEDQVAGMQSLDAEVAEYKASFNTIEELHRRVQDALIFENPHTTITVEELRGTFHQLSSGIKRSITELNNQILTRDAKHITEEQLKEYRDSFKHFDKDNSGKLERREFRSCLIACGYDIPQKADPENDPEFERVLARVDPNGDGVVSFDEFIAFMAEEHADAETSEQLLEAFQVIAGANPYVTAEQLQKELAPELAQYCIQNMSPYEGGPAGALDYQSFASALYGETDL
eukprot:m.155408 g.155408  ORF g.155408 m.155408 type:complete len:878 (-) comp20807_c8_seq1:31-2664(-)